MLWLGPKTRRPSWASWSMSWTWSKTLSGAAGHFYDRLRRGGRVGEHPDHTPGRAPMSFDDGPPDTINAPRTPDDMPAVVPDWDGISRHAGGRVSLTRERALATGRFRHDNALHSMSIASGEYTRELTPRQRYIYVRAMVRLCRRCNPSVLSRGQEPTSFSTLSGGVGSVMLMMSKASH